MHGLVNVLSVTLTILFGLLLIYALCMMIIPQLITSVTTLYYTAQRNLAKFVQWANHVEFIENNQQIMDMLNSAYATISTNIDDLIKTRLLPSMQNIVSGAAVGVLNVVTMAKNLIIASSWPCICWPAASALFSRPSWCSTASSSPAGQS